MDDEKFRDEDKNIIRFTKSNSDFCNSSLFIYRICRSILQISSLVLYHIPIPLTHTSLYKGLCAFLEYHTRLAILGSLLLSMSLKFHESVK